MENYNRVYDTKWNFKDGSMKDLTHGLHPYPAMLMPLIARELFKIYGKKENTIFLDPFVGSGTTLVEAQLYNVKEAYGIDLNPLAILISKVKTSSINLDKLELAIEDFKSNIKKASDVEPPTFSIRDSWFNQETIKNLAKIKNYIEDIKDIDINNFFKVSFSEVVRLSSETRNGEFKLYRMSTQALKNFKPEPIKIFIETIDRNFNILTNNSFTKESKITLFQENTLNLNNHEELKDNVDLIITSPPYGDSRTTVAYGQFSRLSNEWLGFSDAGSLDRRLLGGCNLKNKKFEIEELDDVIEQIRNNDKEFNRTRCPEVISFYSDYEKSIKAVANTVKKDGYVIFIVGNRRVRNIELPTDVITYKMFEKLGFEHEITYVRDILNKRMPSKASPSNAKGGQIPTMSKEYIVVMKKL